MTGEPVTGVNVTLTVQEVRGSGIFGYVRDISKKVITTDDNGQVDVAMLYENSNNFVTISVVDELCTNLLTNRDSYYFEELPLEFEVRKYFPMEILVRNVNPYDENDTISVSFYHVGSNYHSAPLYAIDHRGDVSEP